MLNNGEFSFQWKIGTLQDSEALSNLKKTFPQPAKPMGEAWFMGDRKYFNELCKKDFKEIKGNELSTGLFEIASGINCFGKMEEWTKWLHYFLANLSEQAFDSYVYTRWVESLISAFMSEYPEGVKPEPYNGFLEDIFKTLAISNMHPDLWHDDEIIPEKSLLNVSREKDILNWHHEVSGDFSSLMFFCLKYLPSNAINEWVLSIVNLPSNYYHAQFLLWLLGSREVIMGKISSPADLSNKKGGITIEWGNSHTVNLSIFRDETSSPEKAVFLPQNNVIEFQEAVSQYLTQEIVLNWLLNFENVPVLKKAILESDRDKDFLGMFNSSGKFILYS